MDAPRPFQWLLIVAFAGALVLPVALFGLDAEAMERERRTPAPPPDTPTRLGPQAAAWPRALEAWFDDRFGLRTSMIRLHNALKLKLLATSPSERVMVGEDGWIFIGAPDYVANYRATRPFTEEELYAWVISLQRKRDLFAKVGARYLFAVGPSKSTIYPEKMPGHLTRLGERTRCDQLLEALARTDIPFVDLRPPLLEAKRDGPLLYYPHGSHWNELGGWVAAQALAAKLRAMGFALPADPIENYHVVERSGVGADSWPRRLHVHDLFSQSWTRVVRIVPPAIRPVELGTDESDQLTFRPGGALPEAVLLRDSFGTALAPVLAPYFSRLTAIWQWTTPPGEVRRAIADDPPDVVVDLVVERLLIQGDPLFLGGR